MNKKKPVSPLGGNRKSGVVSKKNPGKRAVWVCDCAGSRFQILACLDIKSKRIWLILQKTELKRGLKWTLLS